MKVKKFEYLFDYRLRYAIETGLLNHKDYLNKRGLEGWELVSVVPNYITDSNNLINSYHFHFKRRIE